MSKDSVVRSRIDKRVKDSVEAKLNKMGLEPSNAIRMFYMYIDNYNKLPFEVALPEKYEPNDELKKDIEETRKGINVKMVGDVEGLKKDLGL